MEGAVLSAVSGGGVWVLLFQVQQGALAVGGVVR